MKASFVCLLLWSCPLATRATVVLPDIFSDHAVLQKSAGTAVWGTAAPGEAIMVSSGTAPARQTAADGQGKWRVELDLSHGDSSPFDLTVKGSGNTLVIHDVVAGEVWIASGQSNMEFKLARTIGGPEEVARSENPNLRCFLPKLLAAPAPADTMAGRWIVAAPATSGEFSGVAYYFAKTLEATLRTPVGLIDTSVGGTPAEAWISAGGMDRDPALKARKDAVLADASHSDETLKQYNEDFRRWTAKYQRNAGPAADPAAFADPAASTADWKTVTLPGELSKQGLPDDGVVWLRRDIDLPEGDTHNSQPLFLGTLRDFDTVYWNGKKVGETTASASTDVNLDLHPTTERRYNVPGSLLRPGKNTLAIRLSSPGGGAAVLGSHLTAGTHLRLAGPWQAKVERAFPPLPPEAAASYPRRPPFPNPLTYNATYMFNGLVQPLTPMTLRGVIWFQGEANIGRAAQYRTTFPLLIEDWREHFRRPDLPFYFCQIANFLAKRPQPGESDQAELREAQTRTLSLPYTGMAVLVDIGEEWDVHFRNKKGRRGSAGGRRAGEDVRPQRSRWRPDLPGSGGAWRRGDRPFRGRGRRTGGPLAPGDLPTEVQRARHAATGPQQPGERTPGFCRLRRGRTLEMGRR